MSKGVNFFFFFSHPVCVSFWNVLSFSVNPLFPLFSMPITNYSPHAALVNTKARYDRSVLEGMHIGLM